MAATSEIQINKELINLIQQRIKSAAKIKHDRFMQSNPENFRDALLKNHGYRANFIVAHGFLNQRGARRLLERRIAKAKAKGKSK
jgi:hypothetical protein